MRTNNSHKVGPKSVPFIFLGYPLQHKGFRCLNLETQDIIISHHFTFDETIFPFGSMTPDLPPSYEFLNQIDDHHIPSASLRQTSPTHTSPTLQNYVPPPSPVHGDIPASPSTSSTAASTVSPFSSAASLNGSGILFCSSKTTKSLSPDSVTSLDPSLSPPAPSHPMVTRSRVGIVKPIRKLNLHVDTSSPIPHNNLQGFKDPHWFNAMKDEFNALITNKTWVLAP